MTLTEFLLARIAEDEAVARGAIRFRDAYDDEPSDDGQEWTASGNILGTTGDIYLVQPMTGPFAAFEPDQVISHMARWDPARVLAECEAKRRIMARHAAVAGDRVCPRACAGCGYSGPNEDPVVEDVDACPELRDLALPYADHPDYREEWKL